MNEINVVIEQFLNWIWGVFHPVGTANDDRNIEFVGGSVSYSIKDYPSNLKDYGDEILEPDTNDYYDKNGIFHYGHKNGDK